MTAQLQMSCKIRLNALQTFAFTHPRAAPVYVCLCNALTDHHVREAAHAGAARPSEVYEACGCVVQCGMCSRTVRRIVDDVAACGCTPELLAAD
jgi:bacterioferritin-associated ferredoxin